MFKTVYCFEHWSVCVFYRRHTPIKLSCDPGPIRSGSQLRIRKISRERETFRALEIGNGVRNTFCETGTPISRRRVDQYFFNQKSVETN